MALQVLAHGVTVKDITPVAILVPCGVSPEEKASLPALHYPTLSVGGVIGERGFAVDTDVSSPDEGSDLAVRERSLSPREGDALLLAISGNSSITGEAAGDAVDPLFDVAALDVVRVLDALRLETIPGGDGVNVVLISITDCAEVFSLFDWDSGVEKALVGGWLERSAVTGGRVNLGSEAVIALTLLLAVNITETVSALGVGESEAEGDEENRNESFMVLHLEIN